jgi:hypothetical protein
MPGRGLRVPVSSRIDCLGAAKSSVLACNLSQTLVPDSQEKNVPRYWCANFSPGDQAESRLEYRLTRVSTRKRTYLSCETLHQSWLTAGSSISKRRNSAAMLLI